MRECNFCVSTHKNDWNITKIFSVKLGEMKTLQKLRKRQNGVNIVSLALGKKDIAEDEALVVRDDKALTSQKSYTVL